MFNMQDIIKNITVILEERATKQEVQNFKNLKMQCASLILGGLAKEELSGIEKVEIAIELTNELFDNKERIK
jgi:hypothetical protein